MGSVNKVILVGNLGRDPEMRYTPNGQAVTQFTVAVNRNYKDQDGAWQEETEWFRVVVFGQQAEHALIFAFDGTHQRQHALAVVSQPRAAAMTSAGHARNQRLIGLVVHGIDRIPGRLVGQAIGLRTLGDRALFGNGPQQAQAPALTQGLAVDRQPQRTLDLECWFARTRCD